MQWEYEVDENPDISGWSGEKVNKKELNYLNYRGANEWQLCTIYSYGSDVWYYWKKPKTKE